MDSIAINENSNDEIGLSIFSNSFFKNNEYFDNIAEGYTLFGSQLKTELSYTFNPFVSVHAGVYARKDFGNEKFTKIAPLISVKLQKNGYSAIMGNLEGNVSHQLIEPVYNFERLILNHLENGLQFKVNKSKIWSDTWLNWEVQQYLNSNFKEELSGGHSSRILLYESSKGLQIKLPVQGLITHQGGQLDTDTSLLKTRVNVATGIIFKYINTSEYGIIRSVSSENYVCLFKDLSPVKNLSFKQGNGLFLNLNVTSIYDVGASLGYWSGSRYLASHGGDLFQSEASIYGKKGYTESSRNLMFLRLFYQRRVFDALNVDIRFEPFYDINNATLQYSYAVYFTFKKDLNLIRLGTPSEE